MNQGDTLFPRVAYRQLFVVASDPSIDEEQVVLISFVKNTTKEEQCCLANSGDHPLIKEEHAARYKDARVAKMSQLYDLVRSGTMDRKQPISSELIQRLLAGAAQSDFLPEGCREILRRQGLI